VIDLGSGCYTSDVLSSYVQSRAYRAPEVVLGLAYGQAIDLWSAGAVFAELLCGRVLFRATPCSHLLWRDLLVLEWPLAFFECLSLAARQVHMQDPASGDQQCRLNLVLLYIATSAR
jgi:serine/threonine protein kinase